MKQKLKRCKKCRQLVSDPDHCGYCANRSDGLSASTYPSGSHKYPNLDQQEGTSEWDQ